VPGLRHFSGFLVGFMQIEYRQFMPFAYLGALLSTATFLSIGYFCGKHWETFIQSQHSTITDIVMTVALFIVFPFIFRHFLRKIFLSRDKYSRTLDHVT
jgi:membrane protein DedA with SNARE-associated domain